LAHMGYTWNLNVKWIKMCSMGNYILRLNV
jgi:hypothetical protein